MVDAIALLLNSTYDGKDVFFKEKDAFFRDEKDDPVLPSENRLIIKDF